MQHGNILKSDFPNHVHVGRVRSWENIQSSCLALGEIHVIHDQD